LHHSPAEPERQEHPGAEDELHGEVYFLVLAIRRVLLFAEALTRQVDSEKLDAALRHFGREAPGARQARNLYEHIDEYLLDRPQKHMRNISGRISPILICRWDADNVVISYGPERFDTTLAALAAAELGRSALAVWEAELERVKALEDQEPLPDKDDGIPRALQVEVGTSTVIEGGEAGPEVTTGRLLAVRVHEISEAEAERLGSLEGCGCEEG
jgi:hypothetical protein